MKYVTDPSKVKQTKYYNFICMLYITILLIVVSVCSYMSKVGGLIFNEGAAIVPILYLIEGVIAEVYGYSKSRQLVWLALVCETIFVLFVISLVHFPTPSTWHHQVAYKEVLGSSYKILTVNVLLFPIGEFANIMILSKCKILLKGKFFWLRSIFSSMFGEIILAVFGNIIVFSSVLSQSMLFHIMIASFFIKFTFSLFVIIPIVFITNWLKKSEGIDIYDYDISFNPFLFNEKTFNNLKGVVNEIEK